MNLFVLKTWLQARLTRTERGAGLVEYILLVSFIAIAVIAAVIAFRGPIDAKFSEAGSRVSSAPNP
jgi:Flp pilus assembly pilin Flp